MTSAHRRLGKRIEDFHGGRVARAWSGCRTAAERAPGSATIVLTGSDYLAIADHPAIAEAMIASLRTAEGAPPGPGAARPHRSGDRPQAELETEFARHVEAEVGVLCPSGWAANTGLLQVVAGRDVPVYLDVLAHMSLWEGARAAGAEIAYFRHNDLEHLRRRIEARGSGVIVADSIYSTDGSVCPLAGLADLAEEHDCLLVLDESHSLGTHGEHGGGLVADLGLAGRVHFRTASLAKAIPGRAGLIVCDRPEFVDYFKNTAFPAVFSSTLLPHDTAGLSAALEVVREEGWRRDRLRAVTDRLRRGLKTLGYPLGDGDTQIIALEAGSEADAVRLRDELAIRDVFGAAFFPPATSLRRTLVRLSVHAGLSDDDVDRILVACEEARDELGMTVRPSTHPGSARS